MKRKTSRCAKCGVKRNLTRHHQFPKRHYYGDGPILTLCRYCHNEIERLIPFERMPDEFYEDIVKFFLRRG